MLVTLSVSVQKGSNVWSCVIGPEGLKWDHYFGSCNNRDIFITVIQRCIFIKWHPFSQENKAKTLRYLWEKFFKKHRQNKTHFSCPREKKRITCVTFAKTHILAKKTCLYTFQLFMKQTDTTSVIFVILDLKLKHILNHMFL